MSVSHEAPGAITVARLHPLVRDTSRSGARPDERMADLSVAARLLQRAADADETGLPEDPSMWPAWQLLTLHTADVADRLALEPDCPDDVAEAAAYAANMASRYLAAQGLYTQAETQLRAVLATRLRVLGPDQPGTLAARHNLAAIMAIRGIMPGPKLSSVTCWQPCCEYETPTTLKRSLRTRVIDTRNLRRLH